MAGTSGSYTFDRAWGILEQVRDGSLTVEQAQVGIQELLEYREAGGGEAEGQAA